MALSNIFREPRREITESLFGIGVCAAVFGLIVAVSTPLAVSIHKTGDAGTCYLFAFMVLMVGGAITAGMLVVTHFIGEVVCDMLKKRGLDPRPKQRY